VKLKVQTSSTEFASAEEMLIDEAGLDLLIDGNIELGGSFENLDNFQLAYAVLPEDFEHKDENHADSESDLLITMEDHHLETTIWIFSQELATRRGYAKK
jgi:hypothetical protein